MSHKLRRSTSTIRGAGGSGGRWYNSQYGTTNCEAYFYGATGQKLESYSCQYASGSLGATLEGINTYFAGKMLSEKGVFIATDRLGSVRGDSNGVNMSYYPCGEERGQGTTDNRAKFASYYRDMPGQDYANARYYSASSGSFWSPDPKGNGAADTADASGMAASYTPGLGAARPDNPMSWNRYMYSLGDPINFFDPIGKDSCDADGTDCDDDDDPDCGNAQSPCATDPNQGSGSGDCTVQADGTVSCPTTYVVVVADPDPASTNNNTSTSTNFWTIPDVPLYGWMGQGANILGTAGQQANHDLGCVVLGGSVTAGTTAVTQPIISKGFSQGGASGTSLFSVLARLPGFRLPFRVSTPIGMPGTSSWAWRASPAVGAIVGRWLPYAGAAVSAVLINACLQSSGN